MATKKLDWTVTDLDDFIAPTPLPMEDTGPRLIGWLRNLLIWL